MSAPVCHNTFVPRVGTRLRGREVVPLLALLLPPALM